MAVDYVYGATTCTTWYRPEKDAPKRPVRIYEDEAWRKDSDEVKAMPHLFKSAPGVVRGAVEQATAAPGEIRRTKRAASKDG